MSLKTGNTSCADDAAIIGVLVERQKRNLRLKGNLRYEARNGPNGKESFSSLRQGRIIRF